MHGDVTPKMLWESIAYVCDCCLEASLSLVLRVNRPKVWLSATRSVQLKELHLNMKQWCSSCTDLTELGCRVQVVGSFMSTAC